MSNLRHYDNLGSVRFVTFSCYRRLPGFADEKPKRLFVKHLKMAREKHKFKLFGYVIMPEHAHLVILPEEGTKLGLLIREIKSKMAREYFSELDIDGEQKKHVFWQKRCYDHNCRTRETVIEKIKYCHKNPVVRGLVDSPDKYEYSSYNFYSGKINVPILMDKLEI